MTAHFAPFLEGCSLAGTIIGTALRELTVLRARIVSRCKRLILFLLTVVLSEGSICAYAGQQYVSDVMRFPTLSDVTNHHSRTYGLKQVRLSDTADSCVWRRYTVHSDGILSDLPAGDRMFREWLISRGKDTYLAKQVKNLCY